MRDAARPSSGPLIARLACRDTAKAVKATAHQLARLIYALLTQGHEDVERGLEAFEARRRRSATLGRELARVWPPEIRVGGASPSQKPKCRADGKRDRSGPISLASTNTVSIPRVWNAREVHTEDLFQGLMQLRWLSTGAMGTTHRLDRGGNLIGEGW